MFREVTLITTFVPVAPGVLREESEYIVDVVSTTGLDRAHPRSHAFQVAAEITNASEGGTAWIGRR